MGTFTIRYFGPYHVPDRLRFSNSSRSEVRNPQLKLQSKMAEKRMVCIHVKGL